MPPKGTKARYTVTRMFAVDHENRRVMLNRDNAHRILSAMSATRRKELMDQGLVKETYVPVEEITNEAGE